MVSYGFTNFLDEVGRLVLVSLSLWAKFEGKFLFPKFSGRSWKVSFGFTEFLVEVGRLVYGFTEFLVEVGK